MALVVEDGTGLTNSESYISVSEADLYHSNRGNAHWTGSVSHKENHLRKATEYLDRTYLFKGALVKFNQALRWPRYSVTDEEGRNLSNQIPKVIKDAIAELALISLTTTLDPVLTSSNFVKRKKVDSLEIEYSNSAPSVSLMPQITKGIRGVITGSTVSASVGVVR